MKEPLRTYPTIACIDRYQIVAEMHLNRFDEIDEELVLLQQRSDKILENCKDPQNPPLEYFEVHAQLDPMSEERRQCFVIAVIFTLLYFETYIYAYAVAHVEEQYFKDHFGRLTLAQKWSAIPMHITGHPLTSKHSGYQALLQLCEDEAHLTHVKADETEFEGAAVTKNTTQKKINMMRSVRNCRLALREVLNELDELTTQNMHEHAVNLATQHAPTTPKKDSSLRA